MDGWMDGKKSQKQSNKEKKISDYRRKELMREREGCGQNGDRS